MTDERLRVCGHTDPRSCDLSCRVLAIEATQEGSVGRLRALIDAEIRDRTALLDRQAVALRAENDRLRAALRLVLLHHHTHEGGIAVCSESCRAAVAALKGE